MRRAAARRLRPRPRRETAAAGAAPRPFRLAAFERAFWRTGATPRAATVDRLCVRWTLHIGAVGGAVETLDLLAGAFPRYLAAVLCSAPGVERASLIVFAVRRRLDAFARAAASQIPDKNATFERWCISGGNPPELYIEMCHLVNPGMTRWLRTLFRPAR
jgi:hypothetical protein